MNPVKLGIIGCGIAAHELHWPVLKEMKDKFEIIAVCNHTEEKAKEFSHLVGNVPYVLDYKKILEIPDIEAVDIILPIDLNYMSVIDSMKAGKHILVEKPLASKLEEAERLLAAEKNYNKVTMVAENFRFRRAFARIRALIDSGMIGGVYSVQWNSFDCQDRNKRYGNTKWRQENKYVGGFVTDGGVHNIAALRDIFGNLSGAGAFTHQVNPEIGTVDTFGFQFVTGNNVKGMFNNYFSVKGYSENRMLIFGNSGTIIFDNNVLTVKNNEGTVLTEIFEKDDGYKFEFEEFYDCVRNGKPVRSNFFEAYCDLKTIIDAINSSMN
jgi:predicted dehydrogenase